MSEGDAPARPDDERYGLSGHAPSAPAPAPELPYRPSDPPGDRPGIGLVGCGGIAGSHLSAYRAAGYRVVALCDRNPEKVEARRREFFPDAAAYTDPAALLADEAVEIVDATPHPAERGPIVEAALRAGRHVLSQKPFVTDLDEGRRLVDLARERGRKLAVNQNGRWAPHFRWARLAARAGLLGTPTSLSMALHFDHNWTAGTPFDRIHHLLLYDFAIHWFDQMLALLDAPARRVTAAVRRSPGQRPRPPLLAHASVEFDGALATLALNGDTRFGRSDRTVLVGTAGTLVSEGPDLNDQRVALHTADGHARPELEGRWFDDGFHGAMAELLSAIHEDREPENGAETNLESLALCFAALDAADAGEPRRPGEVRTLPASVFGG